MSVISYATAHAVYRVVRKHVTDKQMEQIVDELLQIEGNKAFRETVVRLAIIDAGGPLGRPRARVHNSTADKIDGYDRDDLGESPDF